MAESGISAASKEQVASNFLTGQQVQSVLGGMRGVTEAARGVSDVAGQQADLIRGAGRSANALNLAQVARAVAAAGEGQAAGGGRGRSSGTTALDQMRQAYANRMSTERMAGEAALGAAREGVTVAEAASAEARETAAIKSQQQANVANFAQDFALMRDNLAASGLDDAAIGTSLMGKVNSLDLSDPVQFAAAADALVFWATQRGVRGASRAEAEALLRSGGTGIFARLSAQGVHKDPNMGAPGGGGGWVQNVWQADQTAVA